MVKIYALQNPINGEYFYIGQTIRTLEKRLIDHLKQSNNYKKIQIFREIAKEGLVVNIVLLAEVNKENADYIEKCLIRKYKKNNHLTNIKDRKMTKAEYFSQFDKRYTLF